ncbi:MAG: hypothetical protein H7Y13_09635 [Sphingobacteriaceae bacterium]|nr:hypothetical protein [Sphingobacteriaceae bacterium]
MDVKTTVSGYLEQNKDNGGNALIEFIKRSFNEGKLDHNQIRRAVLQRFQAQDKTAVFFGSLLLQLDKEEIHELLNEKL